MTAPGIILAEERLRGLIKWRDIVAREVARVEAAIADEARAYASAQGVTVRPTINQLRWQLAEKDKAR